MMELGMNVLDIWSSDDEEGGRINLWKDDKGKKVQPVGKVEEKEKKIKSYEPKKNAESGKEEEKKK